MLQPLPIGPAIIQLTSEGHPPMWRLHPDTLLSTRSVPRQSVEGTASGPNNGDHTNVFLHWLTPVAKSQYTNHKKPRWYLQPRLWRRSTQLPYEDVKRAVETTRYKNDMMKQKMFIDVFSFWVVNKRDGTVSLRNCSFTGLRSPLLNSLSWRETNTFQSMGDLWIWSENPLYHCFIQWIQFYDQMELVWKFDCCNTEKCAPGVNVFIKYWGNLTYLFRYVRYESIFGSNKHCTTNGA